MDTLRNDKCEETNNFNSGPEDKKEIHEDKESVQTQRSDEWEELNSFTYEGIVTFGTEDEKEIFEDKESVQTQRNEDLDFELESYGLKNIGQNVYEMTDTLDDENKVGALESIDRNLNLHIFEKWMEKIFPPKKENFLKLSNYSEDDNISNEATHARLVIILIFITMVLCFITFGQIIWILVLSRGPIVVQPFIAKINNPFCK